VAIGKGAVRMARWRSIGALVALTAVLVSAGCTGDAGGSQESVVGGDTAPVGGPSTQQQGLTSDGEEYLTALPSAEQLAAIEDGVVTRDEYVDGFRRYRACMEDLGIELVGGIESATVISPSYLPQGTVEEENCYEVEWREVDIPWQVENNDYGDQIADLVACLTAAGHTPAHDPSAKSVRQFEALEAQRADAGVAESACLPAPPS
jgi:hypothetical protein